MSELLHQLEKIVGPGNVLTGDEWNAHSPVWDTNQPCNAWAVLRPSTTRQVAEEIKSDPLVDGTVEEWQVRRLFEDGDLPEVQKFGGTRVIDSHMLPTIVAGLRARGWLPESEACGTGPEGVNETSQLSRNRYNRSRRTRNSTAAKTPDLEGLNDDREN